MALTRINFYLVVIFLVLIIFVGIAQVGTELTNSDRIDLDIKSLDYILEVKGVNSQSGYDNIAETNSAESQQTELLDSENGTQVSDTNDFLSTLYIKKERASEPTKFFQLIYNIPSSMIRGVGLKIGDWTHYINILSYLFVISILILIWTKLVNT
ncbi:unnamed protein product [marine sediment metagenome]|uniref:Uncharacterized protein n=1 Tax=marine sediment metagenome TaxID=412755 RepID=X1HKJ2_9ZZZZ